MSITQPAAKSKIAPLIHSESLKMVEMVGKRKVPTPNDRKSVHTRLSRLDSMHWKWGITQGHLQGAKAWSMAKPKGSRPLTAMNLRLPQSEASKSAQIFPLLHCHQKSFSQPPGHQPSHRLDSMHSTAQAICSSASGAWEPRRIL